MNLHPQVLQTLSDRGLTEEEVVTLQGRMMFAVTSIEAQITALDAQISALSMQRAALQDELAASSATVAKLLAPEEPPAEPAP